MFTASANQKFVSNWLCSKAWTSSLDCNSLLCWLYTLIGSQLHLNESHVQGPACTIRDSCSSRQPCCSCRPEQHDLLATYLLILLRIKLSGFGPGNAVGQKHTHSMLPGHPPLTHIPRDHPPRRASPGHGQGRANANPTVKWGIFRKLRAVPKDLTCCKSLSLPFPAWIL